MIIKSFKLNDIKNSQSNFFLFYGDNEGEKDDVIKNCFLNTFQGEVIKYDENQILENRKNLFETCLNKSLFDDKKILLISRATSKLYDIIKELFDIEINGIKIIIKSGPLEKKSKIRQLFEKEKNLSCVPFYQDNNATLFRIANEFFKKNKISISSENINLIVEKCSGDRKNLHNEMNKILNFCFQNNKINREEILKLINFYEDENYFDLIDNCLAKNKVKILKIINNNVYSNGDAIILIRSFLSRLKRLIELKKLHKRLGGISETVENFRPQIFWKDKEIVQKQVEMWSIEKVYDILEEVNNLELNFKKNSNLSNNLIFDLILNISNN